MLVIAVYWVSEVLPMAVTALMPVVAFPVLGVMPAKTVAMNYMKDINFLLIGGLMVAIAIEKWNLHKRIALRVLLLVGSKPQWIMFGFMVTTAFLSMWLSNTATTAMMTPIAHAVLLALDENRRRGTSTQQGKHGGLRSGNESELVNPDSEHKDRKENNSDVERVRQEVPPVFVVPERHRHMSNGAGPHQPQALAEVKYHSCPLLDQQDAEEEVSSQTDSKSAAPEKSLPSQPESCPEKTERHGERSFQRLSTGMRICIAYAANIGGSATLTGTAPHLVLKGILDQLYGEENGVGFSSWMAFALPNMVITLFIAWMWLQLLYIGPKAFTECFKTEKRTENDPAAVIREEYNKLGKTSFAEKAVLGHFVLLVVLWLSKEPAKGFVDGWASLPFIKEGYVSDATVAIFVCLCLFMFPSEPLCGPPSCFLWPCGKRKECADDPEYGGRHRHASGASRVTWKDTTSVMTELTIDDPNPSRRQGPPPLLEWKHAVQHMSWGILFIFGAGMAMAEGCKVSGLSSSIGSYLTRFGGWPVWCLVLLLTAVTALVTELTSNTATATIFLPIIAELAESIGVHPLYLMLPTVLACSFAFMLPIATPPNAIVFGYGGVTIRDMVKAGAVMNVISILVLQFSIHTYIFAYMNLGEYPSWADVPTGVANSTASP